MDCIWDVCGDVNCLDICLGKFGFLCRYISIGVFLGDLLWVGSVQRGGGGFFLDFLLKGGGFLLGLSADRWQVGRYI